MISALADRRPLQVVEPVLPRRPWLQWSLGRFTSGRGLPAPDLLIGAGHGTHVAMLAARRACGGKAVVLMKPSLPLSCFDLCVVPEHDKPKVGANVWVSRGVLNRMRAGSDVERQQNLILLGGPSRHYRWDNEVAAAQVEQLLASVPDGNWQVCTSPRSAGELTSLLRQRLGKRAAVVSYDETQAGWLADQLPRADAVWVSEDSASMLYEALTAGAKVGLLPVARTGPSRVSRGADGLLADGLVTGFEDWRQGRGLQRPTVPFNEAERCARWIDEAWLKDR